MFNSKKILALLATMTACGITAPSFAYDAGDMRVRFGVASVQPDDSSSALALNGTELSELGLGLPQTTVQVGDNSQLGLTLNYMLSSDWGIEILASTPFSHDISAAALGAEVGETKHLPPTVMMQYYPMDSNSAFQPFLGVGINYTLFFSEDIDAELDNALEGLGATGGSSLSLDDSIGLALQVGADYKINENWFVNGTIWHIDIDTDATVTTPGLGELTTDVQIDPLVYMLSLGYKL